MLHTIIYVYKSNLMASTKHMDPHIMFLPGPHVFISQIKINKSTRKKICTSLTCSMVISRKKRSPAALR
jgi:hypothetical protein